MLTPHVKTIRLICLDFISSTVLSNNNTNNHHMYDEEEEEEDSDNMNDQFKLVASVFAAYVSMESSESWLSTWLQLCSDGLTMLEMLGVARAKQSHEVTHTDVADRDSSTTYEQLLLIKNPVFSTLRGFNKAIVIHEAFKAICWMLRQVQCTDCTVHRLYILPISVLFLHLYVVC